MTEAEVRIRSARTRPLAATAILSLYLVAAVAMVVLCVRGKHVFPNEPEAEVRALRALFAVAAVANAAIGIGGLRRARWTRPLALGLHALVIAAALFGLATLAIGTPRLGESGTELAAKGSVHGLLALLWWSAWMKRHTSPQP